MKLREIRLDGYKNIAKCKIPIRDFNVIVGPNNSGKSNLLDVFSTLGMLCFTSDEHRFLGRPVGFLDLGCFGFAHGGKKPLSIGISMETEIAGESWSVDFDLTVSRASDDKDKELCGFQTEIIRAKPPSKTGPAKTYLHRKEKTLTIDGKSYPIAMHISVFSALPVLYPDLTKLSPQLVVFLNDILTVLRTNIYALSPETLRSKMGEEISPWDSTRVTGFGLFAAMDKVLTEKNELDHFRETVTDVLDLDDVRFNAFDQPIPDSDGKGAVKPERMRWCILKRKAKGLSGLGNISEFSDGTFIVLALVAAMIFRDRQSGPTCIEELENCLHPMAQQKLLRFLQTNASRWQTIVTTHSPYLVNGVDPDDLLVAVVDEKGNSRFQKPTDRKAINELLKSGYMSFGDLMADNFKSVLKE